MAMQIGHTDIDRIRQILPAPIGVQIRITPVVPFVPIIPAFIAREFRISRISRKNPNPFTRLNAARKIIIGSFQLSLSNNGFGVAVLLNLKAIGAFLQDIKGCGRRVDLKIGTAGNDKTGESHQDSQLNQIVPKREYLAVGVSRQTIDRSIGKFNFSPAIRA